MFRIFREINESILIKNTHTYNPRYYGMEKGRNETYGYRRELTGIKENFGNENLVT